MLEQGDISYQEFCAAIRYRKGPCPPKCPDRDVYCKRSCENWAKHEALNKRKQALKEKFGAESMIETSHRLRAMKIGQR